ETDLAELEKKLAALTDPAGLSLTEPDVLKEELARKYSLNYTINFTGLNNILNEGASASENSINTYCSHFGTESAKLGCKSDNACYSGYFYKTLNTSSKAYQDRFKLNLASCQRDLKGYVRTLATEQSNDNNPQSDGQASV